MEYKTIFIINVAINGFKAVAIKLYIHKIKHFRLSPYPVDFAVTMYTTIMLTETITAAET